MERSWCRHAPSALRDKSNVEGNVRLVYMRVFAELRNETFYSIDELNAAATDKMRKHNQKRMQKNPYTREERFLAIDRPNLRPLPATDFEIVSYTSLKGVHQLLHIPRTRPALLQRAVPAYLQKGPRGLHTLARENLRGRGTRRNAPKRPCQRQVHHRGGAPCKQLERVQGTERRQVHRACQKGVQELAEVMTRIFYDSNMPAETHYRTCDGLLNLQRSSEPVVFRTACETALRHGRCNYRFIRSLVESKCAGVAQEGSLLSPPEHDNIRGREQFR